MRCVFRVWAGACCILLTLYLKCVHTCVVFFFLLLGQMLRAISWHLIDRKRNSWWSRDAFFFLMRMSNSRLDTPAYSAWSCHSLIVSTPASFFLLSMTSLSLPLSFSLFFLHLRRHSFSGVPVSANERCLDEGRTFFSSHSLPPLSSPALFWERSNKLLRLWFICRRYSPGLMIHSGTEASKKALKNISEAAGAPGPVPV